MSSPKYPTKVLMSKPHSLNGILANWALVLLQYDIHFVSQKEIKGQVIADFLVEHPIPKYSKLHKQIPDEVLEISMVSEE